MHVLVDFLRSNAHLIMKLFIAITLLIDVPLHALKSVDLFLLINYIIDDYSF